MRGCSLDTIRRYAVALAVAGSAIALSHAIWPVMEPNRSPLFLAAVAISAWYGGAGPGLLTTASALLGKMYYVMPPRGSLRIEAVDAVQLLVFAMVAVLISSLTGALRRAEAANRALAGQERAARAQAEAATRAREVFLAKIAHELRTPIQAVSSWTRLLARVRGDDRLFDEARQALEGSVRAQGRLIDDLLAVSRIIAGKVDLRLEPLALSTIAEAAVRTATAATARPHAPVRLVAPSEPTTVLGDRVRLEQVVTNLVSNALKFTPAEGRVTVAVQCVGARGRILVADTGCGIAADTLPHVFDEFWQSSGAARPSGAGLGLGLAIVRHLVELHGGSVRAESAGEGHGATFVVELPLAR
jgi:signal transduction histidine kinase